jgi:hypothetical protein
MLVFSNTKSTSRTIVYLCLRPSKSQVVYIKNVSVCLSTMYKTKANFSVFCSDCLHQLESSGFPVGYWRTRAGVQLSSEEHGHVLGNRLQRHLAAKFLWSNYTAARCPANIDVWPCIYTNNYINIKICAPTIMSTFLGLGIERLPPLLNKILLEE